MTLSSWALLKDFTTSRIDYETLAAHSEGLIGLSACLAGDIPKLLEQGGLMMQKQLPGVLIKYSGRAAFI